MTHAEMFTDFSHLNPPRQENDMSRRFLRLMQRWVPVGLRYFNEWSGRPNCGHFFGGVYWYGQETVNPIMLCAVAASSPEYDESVTGVSADELRQVALRGLRYLCFTHDTGPADCVRPTESWGRTEPAGTKWGERGGGFFRESQCGRVVSRLAITAAMIRDLLGDEEREMLAAIAADYIDRFGTMPPKSGVYNNTQTEENAWTAEGLTGALALLPGHPEYEAVMTQMRLWLFRTVTMPQDQHDPTPFANGQTVGQLCGRTFTTLPDITAENHGFVHPNYMGSSIGLGMTTSNVMQLFGMEIPPELLWHRRDVYDLLKFWSDDDGQPQSPQGMDWPYRMHAGSAVIHAFANLIMGDPTAALLERRALAVLETASMAHDGRTMPEEIVEHCHGVQDPALMRECRANDFSNPYLAHRLRGAGQEPATEEQLAGHLNGVRIYPHGGIALHRHAHGKTSLSWRNRTMVLPTTRAGARLVGPLNGSMVAEIAVQNRAPSSLQVDLRLRESADRIAALLIEELAQRSVRRELFFASLPDGRCLMVERLIAQEAITVDQLQQGRLSVINDVYFVDRPGARPKRTIHWSGGSRTVEGRVADSADQDVAIELGDTRWVNIDDAFGIAFRGTGRPLYVNRHFWQPYRAMEDELILSRIEGPASFEPDDGIAGLAMLWCPEQPHGETSRTALKVHETPARLVAASVDGYLCACNFGEQAVELPVEISVAARQNVNLGSGVSGKARADLTLKPSLAGREPVIIPI